MGCKVVEQQRNMPGRMAREIGEIGIYPGSISFLFDEEFYLNFVMV